MYASLCLIFIVSCKGPQCISTNYNTKIDARVIKHTLRNRSRPAMESLLPPEEEQFWTDMHPKELIEPSGTSFSHTKISYLLNFGSLEFESWGFLVDHKILN